MYNIDLGNSASRLKQTKSATMFRRWFGNLPASSPPIKESHCDLIIIGAGPAGLMAALWASRYKLNFRILEKRPKGIVKGHADGIQARSQEIFEGFGFIDRVEKECQPSIEMCFWNPDESGSPDIRRADRVPECIPGSSKYGQVLLHQGRIERFLCDAIDPDNDVVERGVTPKSLEINPDRVEDANAYPIRLKIEHSSANEGQGHETMLETIQANYLVGCDGAHSWTRKQLGFNMEGDQTDCVWGVIDVIPITDFPDIRQACSIHSANSGSILLIPRERKLVRVYVQLTDIGSTNGQNLDRNAVTSAMILEAAQKIFQPYNFKWGAIEWWAVYQIGQRISDRFSAHNRIFLAGDAVHTHSPKAGQGMNVSMQDTYNLGWKLGAVLTGQAKRSILSTYETERRAIAKQLIDFDRRFSRLFSGKPTRGAEDEDGVSVEEFKAEFEKSLLFASGLSVRYQPSELIGCCSCLLDPSVFGIVVPVAAAATRIQVGARFPPQHQVLHQSDARPVRGLGHYLRSDGKWRIILFAGDILAARQRNRVRGFCAALSSRPDSFLHRFTPPPPSPEAKIDSVFEILTVHSSPRRDVDLSMFPKLLRPFDKDYGWDYEKVFVDDVDLQGDGGRAYENWGVDRATGGVVALRPDGYVGWMGEMEDVDGMAGYFEGIFLELRSAE